MLEKQIITMNNEQRKHQHKKLKEIKYNCDNKHEGKMNKQEHNAWFNTNMNKKLHNNTTNNSNNTNNDPNTHHDNRENQTNNRKQLNSNEEDNMDGNDDKGFRTVGPQRRKKYIPASISPEEGVRDETENIPHVAWVKMTFRPTTKKTLIPIPADTIKVYPEIINDNDNEGLIYKLNKEGKNKMNKITDDSNSIIGFNSEL